MNLDVQGWKPFQIGKLFTMLNGKGITQEEISDNEGDFIAVQSGEENNGVMGKIDLNYCKSMKYTYSEKPCLTVARSGSAGFVSYQKNGCVVGDSAKILLLPDEVATTEHYLFLQAMLTANRFKYTYGRKVTEDKYLNDIIDLPTQHNADGSIFIDTTCQYSDDGYVPDWQFMEDYIKSLHYKPLTTKNKTGQAPDLNVSEWKEFRVGDLISEIYKAKAINKDDLTIADSEKNAIHYITRTGENNGCELLADIRNVDKSIIEKGNAISIGDTTATCFYQEENFITGDHMVVVRANSWLNKYTALFIVTLLANEQYKYSYGRAYLIDRIKDTILKLPVNSDGNPDWQFMENYIKALPYGDRLQG